MRSAGFPDVALLAHSLIGESIKAPLFPAGVDFLPAKPIFQTASKSGTRVRVTPAVDYVSTYPERDSRTPLYPAGFSPTRKHYRNG